MSGNHIIVEPKQMKPITNAARERSRVQSLRVAFLDLQRSLPSVPPDTKLSKLDVLVLATAYIYHLTQTLYDQSDCDTVGPTTGSTLTTKPCTRTNISISIADDAPEPPGIRLVTSQQHPDSNQISPSIPCNGNNAETITGTQSFNFKSKKTDQVNLFRTSVAQSQIPPSLTFLGKDDLLTYSRDLEWTRSRNRRQLRPKLLTNQDGSVGILHPVKKWPMRYRLYDKILGQQPTVPQADAWRRQKPSHL